MGHPTGALAVLRHALTGCAGHFGVLAKCKHGQYVMLEKKTKMPLWVTKCTAPVPTGNKMSRRVMK
jgi:hypothetical protein